MAKRLKEDQLVGCGINCNFALLLKRVIAIVLTFKAHFKCFCASKRSLMMSPFSRDLIKKQEKCLIIKYTHTIFTKCLIF